MSKTVQRLKEWFRGYDDVPLWLCFCRLIFALSALSFIISFFGPAILWREVIGFWVFQDWALTHAGFLYIAVIVVTFTLAVIFGVPAFLYKKRMKPIENEVEG